MSSLGTALAIALPLLAGATGGGSPAEKSASASKSKSTGFLSDAANAFLGASGLREAERPFSAAPSYREKSRPVSQLTRGQPVGQVNPTRMDPVMYQMPLYRSVLENMSAKTIQNAQVRDLLDRYSVVEPTKAVGSGGKQVRMTEVNI